MSANFDRFQIGDPMDDQHFICWDEEAPFVRADEREDKPISAAQPVLDTKRARESRRPE